MKRQKNKKLEDLFSKVRTIRRDTAMIEHGFEVRLKVRMQNQTEEVLPLFGWSWRLMPLFVAVVVLFSIVGFTLGQNQGEYSHIASFSNFEKTVLLSYMMEDKK
ncbi:MAG: hypothetical protein L3V56_04695 [Candidatus Magnetoovum sp. WYHC-5]|nr:hypothetical protein [Candidatus Magnetoovum sp. WYHC-5]